MKRPCRKVLAACVSVLVALASPLVAENAELVTGIDIELNAIAAQDTGCLLSFVVLNGQDQDIEQVIYEAVLFNGQGRVHQLTLFDFGALPTARPRVRQFIVPSLECDDLTRIIFNGASTCRGESLAENACTDALTLRSRTTTEVLG